MAGTDNWLQWIIGLLGAGGVGHYLFKNKTVVDKNATHLVNFYKKEFEKYYNAYAKLHSDNADLKSLYTYLKMEKDVWPVPVWEKDKKGVVIYCNDIYEELFLSPYGKTRFDYIGKTDLEFWPSVLGEEIGTEVGINYQNNDIEVLKSRKAWSGIEKIVVEDRDMSDYWLVYKTPTIIGFEAVGTRGVAIPINLDFICNERTRLQ